jgi:hypothetical protein
VTLIVVAGICLATLSQPHTNALESSAIARNTEQRINPIRIDDGGVEHHTTDALVPYSHPTPPHPSHLQAAVDERLLQVAYIIQGSMVMQRSGIERMQNVGLVLILFCGMPVLVVCILFKFYLENILPLRNQVVEISEAMKRSDESSELTKLEEFDMTTTMTDFPIAIQSYEPMEARNFTIAICRAALDSCPSALSDGDKTELESIFSTFIRCQEPEKIEEKLGTDVYTQYSKVLAIAEKYYKSDTIFSIQ